MRRHVDLLSTLYVLWGALGLLISLSVVALGLGLAALIVSASPGEPSTRLTAGVATGIFALLAVMGLLCSAAHFWNAYGLRKHGEWARLFGLVIAVFDFFVVPFGPALAVYAFWVLTNHEVRALFEPSSS
jgi:hypothetical protein